MDINVLYVFDMIGTAAFALSAVIPAIRKDMDLFGIFTIAFVTAIGGGTLRDLLISAPIVWLHNMTYVYIIIGTVILAVIFRNRLIYMSESIAFFDTIGLSAFTLIGIEKAMDAGYSVLICIAIGTMTACFGGVIRDTFLNKIPVIFVKEIYATASIAGGIVFFSLLNILPNTYVYVITGLVVFVIRSLSKRYHITLPTVQLKK